MDAFQKWIVVAAQLEISGRATRAEVEEVVKKTSER
jgi:hypothetical protein